MESTPSSSPMVNLQHQQQQQQQNQQQQLIDTSITPICPTKLTPEQEQEIKLRSKYPNPQKPGASNFIQKMLHKGNRKYFDSGDYNMARSRCKANGSKIQTTTINQQSQETCSSNSSLFESPAVQSTGEIMSANSSTDQIQLTVNNCPVNSSPLTTNQNLVLNGQYPSSPCVINSTNANSYNSLSSSVSTDSEEIGHGIPTPECIQSRKHSIAQSKLATPRLSSS